MEDCTAAKQNKTKKKMFSYFCRIAEGNAYGTLRKQKLAKKESDCQTVDKEKREREGKRGCEGGVKARDDLQKE